MIGAFCTKVCAAKYELWRGAFCDGKEALCVHGVFEWWLLGWGSAFRDMSGGALCDIVLACFYVETHADAPPVHGAGGGREAVWYVWWGGAC